MATINQLVKAARNLNIKKVKAIGDGEGTFTAGMGMLVKKENLGFGDRSWRYAAIINDKNIEHLFVFIEVPKVSG